MSEPCDLSSSEYRFDIIAESFARMVQQYVMLSFFMCIQTCHVEKVNLHTTEYVGFIATGRGVFGCLGLPLWILDLAQTEPASYILKLRTPKPFQQFTLEVGLASVVKCLAF